MNYFESFILQFLKAFLSACVKMYGEPSVATAAYGFGYSHAGGFPDYVDVLNSKGVAASEDSTCVVGIFDVLKDYGEVRLSPSEYLCESL